MDQGVQCKGKLGDDSARKKCILLTQLGLGKLLTRKDHSGRSTACISV